MASPRIVGSPRITTREVSGSKAQARSTHRKTEPENTSSGRFPVSATSPQEQSSITENRSPSIGGFVDETQRKITATAAGSLILWTTMPFYIPQVLFWMLGLGGMGLEAIPIADIFVPGQELFFLGYIVASFIGACSMIYAAWIYVIRGIRCFAGIKLFIFICCLTGYLVVFLNLFPWLILWVLTVIVIKDQP